MADTTVKVKLVLTDQEVEQVLDAFENLGVVKPSLYDRIEFAYLKARGGLPRQEGRLQS